VVLLECGKIVLIHGAVDGQADLGHDGFLLLVREDLDGILRLDLEDLLQALHFKGPVTAEFIGCRDN
jgi:hypothetical protein